MSNTGLGWIERSTSRVLGAVLSIALIGSLVGCGQDTGGRVPVGGTVTLGGEMLDRGTIEFHPVSDGTITGGTVRDGRFDIPATSGALPGKYEVRIFSTDVDAEAEAQELPEDEAPGPESELRPLQPEKIPPRYNVQTELTADIPEEGTTELSFDLEA